MTLHATTPIPAGWYPDPQGSFQQRWWDGEAWTNEFAQYRPTLNYAPTTKPAPAAQHIPVYAPAAPASLNPPAPRADLLGAAPEPVVQQPDPIEPPAPIQFESTPLQATSPDQLLRVQAAGAPAPAEPQAPLEANPLFDSVPSNSPAAQARHVRTTEPRAAAPEVVAVAAAAAPDDYQPFGYTARSIAPRVRRLPTRRYTAPAWILAIVPGLAAGAAVAVAYLAPLYYSVGTVSIIGAVTLVLLIAFGLGDSARLRNFGHERTVPGILGVLGPVYFIARVFVVVRQTGRPGIWLLIVSLLVCGAAAAAYVLVPGLAQLIATLSV